MTSIDLLPLHVDVGRYETTRGIAIAAFLVGWFYYLFLQYPRFNAGLIGEQKVATTLSRNLNDEYSMLNDVQLKDMTFGNIDHIVVGPTGIFVLETKNYKGKISYYGDSWEGTGGKSPSRQARINAMRIKKILASSIGNNSKPFWVQGIVVFADGNVELIAKKSPDYVEIKKIDELADYIKSKPRRYEAKEIEQIEAEIKNHTQADQ